MDCAIVRGMNKTLIQPIRERHALQCNGLIVPPLGRCTRLFTFVGTAEEIPSSPVLCRECREKGRPVITNQNER